jgi:hypothetical protein
MTQRRGSGSALGHFTDWQNDIALVSKLDFGGGEGVQHSVRIRQEFLGPVVEPPIILSIPQTGDNLIPKDRFLTGNGDQLVLEGGC